MAQNAAQALESLLVELFEGGALRTFLLGFPGVNGSLSSREAPTRRIARQAVLLICRWPDQQIEDFFARLEDERSLRRAEVMAVAVCWREHRDAIRLIGLEGVLHSGRSPLKAERVSVSRLLLAASETIEFVERREETKNLLRWCEDREKVSVQLITGEGGCGKTRLMMEVCRRLRQEGWAAGFARVDRSLSESRVETLLSMEAPRMVVLDYAETRFRDILTLLLTLVQHSFRYPLRVILLARNNGVWWSDLHKRNTRIANLLQQQTPVVLAPMFSKASERKEHFRKAAAAFAQMLGKPLPESLMQHPLRDAALAHPLYLWMAALAALQGKVLSEPTKLLAETLDHERRFWRRWLEDQQGSLVREHNVRRWVEPVVAGLTLVGGLPTKEAVRAFARDMEGVPEERVDDVVDLVRELYPGSSGRYVNGLLPGVLGEDLVGEVLQGTAGILRVALAHNPEHTFTVLGRLAKRRPTMKKWLEQALTQHTTLAVRRAAIRAAVQVGAPMESVLMDTVFAREEAMTTKTLRVLVEACPEYTTGLRRVGLALMERLVSAAEQEIWDSPEWKAQRCWWLLKLTHRRQQMYLAVAMMKSARQALELAEQLVEEKGEPFEPVLIDARVNLAVAHDMNGQPLESAAVYERTLPLARRQTSREGRSRLAFLLKNLTAILTDNIDLARAVVVGEESVTLFRQLADEEAFYTHNLVMALSNTAVAWVRTGQHGRAYERIEEAVVLVEGLYASQPDALREEYVRVLGNGIRLAFEMEEIEGVRPWLIRYGEALGAMLVANPDIFLWSMEKHLSKLFIKIHARTRRAGLREEAEALSTIVVRSRARLLRDCDRLSPRDRAVSLDHNSGILIRMGKPEEALLAAREARGIWSMLREENSEVRPDEAINLAIIAEALQALKLPHEAIQNAWDALTIHRERLAEGAENVDAQRRLVWCVQFLARLLDEGGVHVPAVRLRWEGLTHLRALIQAGEDAPDMLFPDGLVHELGWMLFRTAKHIDPGRAVLFMQEASELQVPDPLLQAQLNTLWGELFLRFGQVSIAGEGFSWATRWWRRGALDGASAEKAARALFHHGWLTAASGELEEADRASQEAVEIQEALGEDHRGELANALLLRAGVLRLRGEDATPVIEQAECLFQFASNMPFPLWRRALLSRYGSVPVIRDDFCRSLRAPLGTRLIRGPGSFSRPLPDPEAPPTPLNTLVHPREHPGLSELMKKWAEDERKTPGPRCSLITELMLLDVELEPFQEVMFFW